MRPMPLKPLFDRYFEAEDRMTPEEKQKHQQYCRSLENRIGDLTYREREVIGLRCGVVHRKDRLSKSYVYTREEVGAVFKISRERIGQIEKEVGKKLEWLLEIPYDK